MWFGCCCAGVVTRVRHAQQPPSSTATELARQHSTVCAANPQARSEAIKVRREIPALQAELQYEKDELTIARTEAGGLRRELMAALQASSHCQSCLMLSVKGSPQLAMLASVASSGALHRSALLMAS